MMRRGMLSNDLELAMHSLEFRQTGAMCNVEEADAYWQTHPFVHAVSSTETQVQVMQAVKELKGLFLLVDVPLVLVRDVLLGWRRSCLAVPGKSGATVATFGPWLQDLGLSTVKKVLRAKGHQLDEDCPHGPTEPNCKLRARLHIDKRWVPVDLLLFRFLTLKDRCDVASCGTGCRLCPLSLEVPGNAKASRPVPIRAFRLAIWLNDTFWIPADVDRYLAVEYGPTWYEFSDELVPMPSHAALAERVREKHPSLPSKSHVSGTQKLVETASWEKIAAAVGSELELWQRYFPEVRPSTSVGSLWRQKSEPDERALWSLVRGPVAAEQNLSRGSTSVWLVMGGLLLAASLLRCEAPVPLALPTPGAYGAPPVLAFGLYCFLCCVRPLLQRAACEDGGSHSPLACALAVALLQCGTSAGLLPAIRAVGGGKSLRQTWYSRPAGVPVWQLTVAAGAVHSARVWLSFLSLCYLDPLSFVLLTAFEAPIKLLLPWLEKPGQPQGHLRYLALAMALLTALCQGEELWHSIGARKFLGVAAAFAYALLGTLSTFLRSKLSRVDISKDLLQAGQAAAGFLVLLACGLALLDMPASLAALWQSAQASRFIFLCGLCLVALNVGSPYLLEEVPQSLALLGPGVILLGVAVLQICFFEAMATPVPSSRTLQALLLGLMAAVLHAVAGVPKGKAPPMPPAAKARPAAANPAPQELPKGRRPPQPKAPLSACRKDSSEVGSTATPPTSNDAASSDVAASSDRGLESDSDAR